jgi:hypothetical protein
MCLANRNLSPKARCFLAIGNMCLVLGLLMSIIDKDAAFHNAALYHGLRGLLIGLSIGFNFGALRLAKSCPQPND